MELVQRFVSTCGDLQHVSLSNPTKSGYIQERDPWLVQTFELLDVCKKRMCVTIKGPPKSVELFSFPLNPL